MPDPLDFLMPSEVTLIASDLTSLFSDPQLSPTITYRSYVSRTFVPHTGAMTFTYTDYTLGAVRNEMPSREVAASQGLYRMGDLRFIINRSELSVQPNKDDQIVDGTRQYDLVSWDSDPIQGLWRIVARLVAT